MEARDKQFFWFAEFWIYRKGREGRKGSKFWVSFTHLQIYSFTHFRTVFPAFSNSQMSLYSPA